MAKMLSAKDVAIRAIETGAYPDVYCPGCDGWTPWQDLHDGEQCPRCRGQVEEAKSLKLGLALLTEAEVEAAEDKWRFRERLHELQTLLTGAYLKGKDVRTLPSPFPSTPPAEAPVLKYGNQVLHAPQTSAERQG